MKPDFWPRFATLFFFAAWSALVASGLAAIVSVALWRLQ